MTAARSSHPYTGRVYLNPNAIPAEGVYVTDGQNICKTDRDGAFSLPGWEKCHFIIITVPAGCNCERYYLPVQDTTDEYVFYLDKTSVTAQENHCFIQISDTEINGNGVGEWIFGIRSMIDRVHPAFLIHTGDICYEAGLKRHLSDMNTGNMNCTVRYVIGNHDYVRGTFGEEMFESIYGPTWYSFNVGKIHYIILPDRGGGDYRSLYQESEIVTWLKNDLATVEDDCGVILFDHVGPLDIPSPYYDSTHTICMTDHRILAWIFGHHHYSSVYRQNGILYICTARPDSGGIDSSPAGARVLTVEGSDKLTTAMEYYDLNRTGPAENAVWDTRLNGRAQFCNIIRHQDSLYVGTVDDEEPNCCGVTCLDRKTGAVRWFYQTENSVKSDMAFDGNTLYAMDAEGRLYALDAADGHLLFRNQVEVYVHNATLNTSSGICVSGGKVFAGNASHVGAFDAQTGEKLWITYGPCGANSAASFQCDGHRLIISSHWESLFALDTETGEVLWRIREADIRMRSETAAVLEGGHLLATGRNAIMMINSRTGALESKVRIENLAFDVKGQPAVRGTTAWIPCSRGGLIAFDLKEQEVLWQFATDESILFTPPYVGKGAKTVESSPVLVDDRIIFGANDGYVYVLNAVTGTLIKRYFAGSAVLGKAAVCESHIYAASFDGHMLCFDL